MAARRQMEYGNGSAKEYQYDQYGNVQKKLSLPRHTRTHYQMGVWTTARDLKLANVMKSIQAANLLKKYHGNVGPNLATSTSEFVHTLKRTLKPQSTAFIKKLLHRGGHVAKSRWTAHHQTRAASQVVLRRMQRPVF